MLNGILKKIYGVDAPSNIRNVNLNDLIKSKAEDHK